MRPIDKKVLYHNPERYHQVNDSKHKENVLIEGWNTSKYDYSAAETKENYSNISP